MQSLDNVYLYNIDNLEAIVRDGIRSREQQLVDCHRIIDAQAAALIDKLNSENERRYDYTHAYPFRWGAPRTAAPRITWLTGELQTEPSGLLKTSEGSKCFTFAYDLHKRRLP